MSLHSDYHIKDKSNESIQELYNNIINNVTSIKEHFTDINTNNIQEHFQQEHFKKKSDDIFKKIAKFFKDIEKFFKQVKKAFEFNTAKMIAVISTIIIPFVGQLIGRLVYLDGSLDKPWLLFFSIPPLSLLPAFMMMFGLIKKGKGGKPWDSYIILPIIVNIIATFVLPRYYDENNSTILKYIFMAISFIIIYWIRSRKICNNEGAKMTKIASDSLLTYILMVVFTIALPYVPFLGVVIKIISKIIPFADIFMNALSILTIYVITNMINGSSKKYCNETMSETYLMALIVTSIILAFSRK